MVSVASYDWESDTWTHNGDNPARTAWHEAVTQVAEKAKATLPECTGRVEKAVQIVLNGDVELLQDGKAKVASQSNGTTQYFVVKGECTCKDYPKAPQGFCMHRLAYGIHKRAYPLAKAKLDAGTNGQTTAPAQPEAPVETPQGIPPQFIVEIQGRPFVQFAGLLALAHARGLASLTADFLTVTADLALAHAVATFQDGRVFAESGDATPDNVNKKVRPHFARMALTRAKARALRDALNIGMCSLEELAE